MELILVVALIAYAFYPLFLGRKVKGLQERIDRLEQGARAGVRQPQSTSMYAETQEDRLATIPQAKEVDVGYSYSPNGLSVSAEGQLSSKYNTNFESKPNIFWEWIKEDFFVKLGAFLLLLALGWFVSYAFMNNWIGPAGRIFLGLSLGVVMLVLGIWRIQTHGHQGGIFTAVGATTVMMTLFAAREIYDFFTPVSALFVMFMTVVFVAFVSVRYQRQSLALAGLVLASVAPLFTSVQNLEIVVLFSYLLVVLLGTLWVVAVTGWSRLIPISLFISFMYSLPFLSGGYMSQADRDTAVIFSFIFVSLFFVANIVSILRRIDTEHMHNHSVTALGSAVFLFVWIQTAVASELQSLLYVAWALVFSVGAYLVHYYSYNRTAFFLYGGTGVALLAAATAAELDGPVLTIAYLFEISAIIIASVALRAEKSLVTKLCLLYIVPVLMSIDSIGSYKWRDSILHEDFLVVSLTIITLLLVGFFIQGQQGEEEVDKSQRWIAQSMIIAGFVYLAIWVWLVFHALFGNQGTMFSLFIYTVTGIALYIQGKHQAKKHYHIAGVCLISFVVARLLFIDVWDMELVERIITFCIVGVLLMSTAFMRKNKKNEVEEINNHQS